VSDENEFEESSESETDVPSEAPSVGDDAAPDDVTSSSPSDDDETSGSDSESAQAGEAVDAQPEVVADAPSDEAAEPETEVVAEASSDQADEAAEPETAAEAPAQAQAPAAAPEPAAEAEEFLEEAPREKPAIPGADLTPDIVSDADTFLDAEARAAAEAEAEEAAARAAEDEPELSQPIADAAIDLAAGARYTATGKRKTAVARVILKPGTGTYVINGRTLEEFFPRETLGRIIRQPLETVGYESRMDVIARMHGGGVSAQAGALRHGISRALIVADPHLRGELKRRGFLTRDPRVKERKKAGLKKARKRPQFSKR
jgi:small subunit ribosomal protein S9